MLFLQDSVGSGHGTLLLLQDSVKSGLQNVFSFWFRQNARKGTEGKRIRAVLCLVSDVQKIAAKILLLMQNSADSGCVAPEVESDCSELGGLPICRSLSRRKSMCKQPPPIPLSDFTIHPSALEPSAAASAAARSLIGHSQHTRRKSAARYVPMHSSLSLTSRVCTLLCL